MKNFKQIKYQYLNPLNIWSKNPIFFLFPMLFDPTLKGKPSGSTSFSTPFQSRKLSGGSRRKASKCTTGYLTFLLTMLFAFLANGNVKAMDSTKTAIKAHDFRMKSLQVQQSGMKIMGGWALSNITLGMQGWSTQDGQQKYFHQMNTLWNTVNLGIAAYALHSLNKKARNLDQLSAEKYLNFHQKSERILLMNAAVLDVLYIAGGISLKQMANQNPEHQDMLNGYGDALILQGSFLMILDAIMYGLLRSYRANHTKRINISLAAQGINIRLNINHAG